MIDLTNESDDENALEKTYTEVAQRSRTLLNTIMRQEWLCDDHINAFLFDLSCRAPGVFLDTYVFRDISQFKPDLNYTGKYFFPIHLPGHWVLAIVDMAARTIVYYDSMLSTQRGCVVLNLLNSVFVRAFVSHNGGIEPSTSRWLREWIVERNPPRFRKRIADCPQQRDGYSCGTFVCFFADAIARGQEPNESNFYRYFSDYFRMQFNGALFQRFYFGLQP